MVLGADMVLETVDDIIAGTVKTISQEELLGGAEPTPAPKIFKDTCHLDWSKDAISIQNLIRGLSPYPAAWSNITKGDKQLQIKVYESVITEKASSNCKPGEIKVIDGKILVATADKFIEINSLQQSGKKRMGYQEFLRGFDLNGLTLE